MTPAERETLILSLEQLVLLIARSRARSLPPYVRREDLISAGWVGAIQAVDRWNPERGSLDVYASARIRGAIGDYLRSVDRLSRDHRRTVKRGDVEEPAIYSLDAPLLNSTHHEPIGPLMDAIADSRPGREQERIDARITLRSIYSRAALRPRNAEVLKRYMEGEVMSAIGRSLGVNESRISQICSRAIDQLREAA